MHRTVVIRVGPVAQVRRELKEDLAGIVRGARVRHRREIWFPSLAQLASVLTERRLELVRLIHRARPRSVAHLARLAGRSTKPVEADLRALEKVGLVKLVPAGTVRRPVAEYDRIQLWGDIAIARAAA